MVSDSTTRQAVSLTCLACSSVCRCSPVYFRKVGRSLYGPSQVKTRLMLLTPNREPRRHAFRGIAENIGLGSDSSEFSVLVTEDSVPCVKQP